MKCLVVTAVVVGLENDTTKKTKNAVYANI